MRPKTNIRGYTIIEVMLFLAISGFMFIIAAQFISGKQSKAEFRQGINSAESRVRQTINDVSNGIYPPGFDCNIASGLPQLVPKADPETQGDNCIFLGKVLHFRSNGSDNRGYEIYNVAGLHYQGGDKTAGILPSSFDEARPTASTVDGLNDSKELEWGLQATSLYVCKTGAADCSDTAPAGNFEPLAAIGFFGSFSSYAGSPGGGLNSGSQNVLVVPVRSDAPGNETADDMVALIKQKVKNQTLTDYPNPKILICLTGGANQFATLTVGGASGQRLTTNLQVYNDAQGPCA